MIHAKPFTQDWTEWTSVLCGLTRETSNIPFQQQQITVRHRNHQAQEKEFCGGSNYNRGEKNKGADVVLTTISAKATKANMEIRPEAKKSSEGLCLKWKTDKCKTKPGNYITCSQEDHCRGPWGQQTLLFSALNCQQYDRNRVTVKLARVKFRMQQS